MSTTNSAAPAADLNNLSDEEVLALPDMGGNERNSGDERNVGDETNPETNLAKFPDGVAVDTGTSAACGTSWLSKGKMPKKDKSNADLASAISTFTKSQQTHFRLEHVEREKDRTEREQRRVRDAQKEKKHEIKSLKREVYNLDLAIAEINDELNPVGGRADI
ncbi:MAG: hypothetical protein SGARI_006547 [Bacillariaceae sp.]